MQDDTGLVAPGAVVVMGGGRRLGRAWAGGVLLLCAGVGALGWGLASCNSGPAAGSAGSVSVAVPEEPELRVRIRAGIGEATVAGPAQLRARAGSRPEVTLRAPVRLTVETEPGLVMATDGAGESLLVHAPESLELSGVGADAVPVTVDRRPYAGRLRVTPREEAASFDIVELVATEEYLPGVVVSELLPTWQHPRVFEVQAVSARTYALHQRSIAMAQNRQFDLEASTRDQAYGGLTDREVAHAAVRATRGVVLTCEGHLLRAYYSSTCGGRPASAADTWPTGSGYEYNEDAPLQAHAREALCQESPLYRWEVTRNTDELSRRIREWGKATGSPIAQFKRLATVTVERRASTERPATYRVRDSSGAPFTLTAEELRMACNQSVTGLPDITRQTRVASGDLEMDIGPDQTLIRGRGFGHGVGMCQYCAEAMARRGDAMKDMLVRFYPGARLERAYR